MVALGEGFNETGLAALIEGGAVFPHGHLTGISGLQPHEIAFLLDEAEQVVKLLERLGISPAQLGPLAEAGGLGPAALKASAAIRALVESQLSGEPLTLKGVSEEERSLPAGFDKKLDELLGSSAAAQRLRATILR